MRGRRPNPKLAKIHRTYSIDEAAKLFGVHRNTVRLWIKRGLPCIDSHRPTLISGQHLADFVRVRRSQNKRPCQAGEIYCMRCREPRQPANQQAVYRPLTAATGNLIGLCPTCSSRMFRRVSFSNLALVSGPLRITFSDPQEHIDESPQASVNSDFNEVAPNHDNTQRPQ